MLSRTVGTVNGPKCCYYYAYLGKEMAGREPVRYVEDIEESRRHTWQESKERIRQLYDQGVPIFSQVVFRNLFDQLEYCRANPTPPEGATCHP